jgi:hypothetical protein
MIFDYCDFDLVKIEIDPWILEVKTAETILIKIKDDSLLKKAKEKGFVLEVESIIITHINGKK